MKKTKRVRKELDYLRRNIESQQTNYRFAAGLTGTTAVCGALSSLVVPPVGLFMFAVGTTGYGATKLTNAAMNKANV